jgi:hypothetical protein
MSMANLDVIHAAEALAATPTDRTGKEHTRLHYAYTLGRYVEGRRRELNTLIARRSAPPSWPAWSLPSGVRWSRVGYRRTTTRSARSVRCWRSAALRSPSWR